MIWILIFQNKKWRLSVGVFVWDEIFLTHTIECFLSLPLIFKYTKIHFGLTINTCKINFWISWSKQNLVTLKT